jgi:hypothetical protein
MNNNYSWALAGVAGAVAVVIAMLVGFGVEAKDAKIGADAVVPRHPDQGGGDLLTSGP